MYIITFSLPSGVRVFPSIILYCIAPQKASENNAMHYIIFIWQKKKLPEGSSKKLKIYTAGENRADHIFFGDRSVEAGEIHV